MAIPHAQPGQPVDIRPLGSRLSGEKSVALFKSDQLEVMRVVLPAGKSLPPHAVAGELTIQCLEGRVGVTVNGEPRVLDPGHLLYLPGGVLHDVVGIDDSSALVTLFVGG